MAKYSKDLVNRIVGLIESDSYTVAEICAIVGISKDTFHTWINTKPDFSDSIKRAKSVFDENLVAEARKSLMKKIKGYTVDETKTIYVDSKDKAGTSTPKIKEKTITKKHYQPDTTAIIFALTNKAPDEYKNRQNSEVTGKNGAPLNAPLIFVSADNLSEEQLQALIRKELNTEEK